MGSSGIPPKQVFPYSIGGPQVYSPPVTYGNRDHGREIGNYYFGCMGLWLRGLELGLHSEEPQGWVFRANAPVG